MFSGNSWQGDKAAEKAAEKKPAEKPSEKPEKSPGLAGYGHLKTYCSSYNKDWLKLAILSLLLRLGGLRVALMLQLARRLS